MRCARCARRRASRTAGRPKVRFFGQIAGLADPWQARDDTHAPPPGTHVEVWPATVPARPRHYTPCQHGGRGRNWEQPAPVRTRRAGVPRRPPDLDRPGHQQCRLLDATARPGLAHRPAGRGARGGWRCVLRGQRRGAASRKRAPRRARTRRIARQRDGAWPGQVASGLPAAELIATGAARRDRTASASVRRSPRPGPPKPLRGGSH